MQPPFGREMYQVDHEHQKSLFQKDTFVINLDFILVLIKYMLFGDK